MPILNDSQEKWRWCGKWTNQQQAPPMFQSTSNLITITFHSGTNDWNYEGFHLKWVNTGVGCQEDIELTEEEHSGKALTTCDISKI